MAVQAMAILIADAWAHRDASRAHAMSALWPRDDPHDVDADWAYAAWSAAAVVCRAISLYKLMAGLPRTGRGAHAVQEGTIEALVLQL